MKKAGKITLYVLGILILFAILLGVFRGSVVSFILKKVISARSDGKVELALESSHIDLLSGYMSVVKPTLRFSDLYMDETKSVKIHKIKFEKIEIDKLNVWKLIFDQDIIARSFLVDKPVFWLMESGIENKSDFHPEKLIKTLNQNPDIFSRIRIRIGIVKIHYGSIKLSEYALPDTDQGLVDFTILLKNFDTHPDTVVNPNRILYSDEFMLKLRNLQKELQSGYVLSIDTAVFSSKYRDMIVNGVSLQPGASISRENNIGIKVGRLTLNNIGLDEIRGVEDLNLRSVEVSDGIFINYINKKDKVVHKEADSVQSVNRLIKVLYDFKLDSIAIHNFNYYNIKNDSDTLITAAQINFLITGLKIDSTMIDDLFWNLHYDNIIFKTGSFTLKKLIPGYFLEYNGLSYANDERKLRLKSIYLTNDTVGADQSKTNLNIPRLEIDGLSLKDLQKRKEQHLSVSIVNPDGGLDITPFLGDKKAGANRFLFPGYLYLDKVEVLNGNFHVIKGTTLEADIKSLNLLLTGLHLPETKHDGLRLKHIALQYDGLNARLTNKSMRVHMGSLNYKEGSFSIHDVTLQQNKSGGKTGLHLKTLNIRGFDRQRLMYDHELYVDSLIILEPDLNGRFMVSDSNGTPSQKPIQDVVTPFFFQVNHLIVKSGKFKNTIIYKGQPVKIKTGYDLTFGPLQSAQHDSLKTALSKVNWQFKLNNLEATAAKHQMKIKSLLTDSYRSEFSFKDLSVAPEPGTEPDSNKITIRSLTLPSVTVSGLNYGLLIHRDSLSFHALQIEEPYIDLMLPEKKDSLPEPDKGKKFDPQDYLLFSYDTIELNRLNMKIEKKGPSESEFVNLKGLNFGHFKGSHQGDNLINDLIFNFEEFNFYDSITNRFLNVSQGKLDGDKAVLSLKGIKGSNLVRNKNGSVDLNKRGMSFNSSDIELTGISVSKTLPAHVNARKMSVPDVDIEVVQKPQGKDEKSVFKVDLDLMRKFDKVLVSLQLDTAMLSDVSFNIHSLSDSTESTIRVDSIGVIAEKLQMDTSMEHKEKPDIIDRITIDLKGNARITKDSLYEVRTGKLHYNFADQIITIDSFYLIPQYKPEDFFRRAKYQTDRVALFSRKLEIDNVNLEKLLTDDHLHVSNVHVFDLNAELFRDKHYPIKPGTYKPLPRELLMNVKRAFTIDSLQLTNAYLKYREMDARFDEPGEVFFDRFNATAYNLTNQIKADEKKDLIVVLQARIMSQTMMNLNIHFPLNPDTLAFWMSGSTEKMDLTLLNPLTTNLLGIGIIKGKGRVNIPYIAATDSTAMGLLIFRYRKLRILPYNRKKDKLKKGFLTPLVSFMINDLVVKSNNPKFARKPRIGQVYFERDTQKSIVNYVWKSVLSGLMSTLGFNNKIQRQGRKEVKKDDKKN